MVSTVRFLYGEARIELSSLSILGPGFRFGRFGQLTQIQLTISIREGGQPKESISSYLFPISRVNHALGSSRALI